MFSVGYSNNSMVINTNNNRRINFQNVEKLRGLVIQTLQSPCEKLIINLHGVKFIDSASFAAINQLNTIATRKNIDFVFTNIDKEVLELFNLVPEAASFKVEEKTEVYSTRKEEVLVS